MNLPSLGSATGTRVDSAAKHIMACKVDTNQLIRWITEDHGDSNSFLHNNKMKYCMHKDELVLNTTKKITRVTDSFSKAYPLVVTTVGDMHEVTQHLISSLYAQSTASDFYQKIQAYQDCSDTTCKAMSEKYEKLGSHTEKNKVVQSIRQIPEFRCQGVALGQGWASYMSGDTVASVLVGGMVTIQNGAFSMHTGDLVQWYFDWESDEFENSNNCKNGRRKTDLLMARHEVPFDERIRPTPAKKSRKQNYADSRLYGTGVSYGPDKGQKNTKKVARIKSYQMMIVGDPDKAIVMDHFGDHIRIFAKCISGGRAFDMVDIMIMTQSS